MAAGVEQRRFTLIVAGEAVPGVLWLPESVNGPRPLVLLGYGSGGYARDESRAWQATTLVRDYGLAAASIDIPGHGDRANTDYAAVDWGRLVDQVIAEWRALLDALAAVHEIDAARSAYRGNSLGAMLGIPLVAAEPRIRAAALGLADLRDTPGFATGIGVRLAHDAPLLRCPVRFFVQWDDEVIDRESAFRLFDLIGSEDKEMHVHRGRHSEMPEHVAETSLRFLADYIGGRPA